MHAVSLQYVNAPSCGIFPVIDLLPRFARPFVNTAAPHPEQNACAFILRWRRRISCCNRKPRPPGALLQYAIDTVSVVLPLFTAALLTSLLQRMRGIEDALVTGGVEVLERIRKP